MPDQPPAADLPAAGPAGPGDASGPVLQLLASALQLWLRQQCQSIDSLDIQLHGSAFELLRGRLQGATVLARRAVFQSLQIERVQLSSGPIRLQMGNLLKGQALQLEEHFAISGQLSLSGDGLSRSLGQPAWRQLGDNLAETLIGLVPLRGVRIERDSLVLSAEGFGRPDPVELETRLEAVDGTVQISSLDGRLSARLPMDPAIRIERACIEAGMVQLQGRATVFP